MKIQITKHTRLIIEWKIHGKEAAREIYKLNESETEFEITPEQFIEWRTQIQESNIELNEKGEREIEDFVKMRLFNTEFRSAVEKAIERAEVIEMPIVAKLNDKSSIMRRAWQIRRIAAKKHGCKVSEILMSESLRLAWSEARRSLSFPTK